MINRTQIQRVIGRYLANRAAGGGVEDDVQNSIEAISKTLKRVFPDLKFKVTRSPKSAKSKSWFKFTLENGLSEDPVVKVEWSPAKDMSKDFGSITILGGTPISLFSARHMFLEATSGHLAHFLTEGFAKNGQKWVAPAPLALKLLDVDVDYESAFGEHATAIYVTLRDDTRMSAADKMSWVKDHWGEILLLAKSSRNAPPSKGGLLTDSPIRGLGWIHPKDMEWNKLGQKTFFKRSVNDEKITFTGRASTHKRS